MLTGPDAPTLHEENIAKLSSMTEEEILAKREELLGMLKPENVEFLKKRRKLNDTVNLESSFTKLSTDE